MIEIDYEIIIRFLLAALWGGAVGLEREYRSKSAGLRTMMMISLGSCFFTMISTFLGENATPDRIAANIVTGVGFLGAGVIFRSENKVNGITTAATIWTVAAVGMAIGAGHYFASAVGSILILIVLGILTIGERVIENLNTSKTYSIECAFTSDAKKNYRELFASSGLKFKLIKEIKEGKRLVLVWAAIGRARDHEKFIGILSADEKISRLEMY